MVYSLTYRRPSYVASSRDSISGEEKQKSINESITSGSSGMSHGIPDALSFDRIISGGVCPPCTVRDFMNYLRYIEHAAENLQFFLWYRDYSARFNALPASEKALAPEWTQAKAEAEASAAAGRSRKPNPQQTQYFQGLEFDDASRGKTTDKSDPFSTPPAGSLDEKREGTDYASTAGDITNASGTAHRQLTEQAFDEAGMKWQPFSMQPYRDEISRIIAVYIAEGAPRELNLSGRERQAVLHALQNTTNPSAFREIVATVEWSLRKQAHPNFIRWTICNGNNARVCFALVLGYVTIAISLLADILVTLSKAGRGWRVFPFIGYIIGIATLIAAKKGMCVVLHGMHHRNLRPWELFADSSDDVLADDKVALSSSSLLSNSTNSFEDEPWIPRYEKRNLIRKIFDREVWVQEPALRSIQDTIFLQSVAAGFVLGAVATAVFCAVPHGNFF